MFLQVARLRSRKLVLPAFITAVLLVSAILPLSVTNYYPQEEGNAKSGLVFDKLALSFEPNEGQASAPARFVTHAPGSTIYFSPSDVAIEMRSVSAPGSSTTGTASTDAKDKAPMSKLMAFESAGVGPSSSTFDPANRRSSSTTVRMQFVGSNPEPEMASGELLPGKVSYFMGNDPKQWHSNLPTYAGVVYRGLYPGIDLKYEGTASNLKGTYTLAPGIDPAQIRWRYDGTASTTVDASGNLQISYQQSGAAGQRASAMTLAEQAPVAWQEIGGKRVPVDAGYVLAQDGSISFALGSYDRTQPLTIDPTLTYSTYLGGNFAEYGFGITADSAGNFYVVGMTNSSNFPTVNPYQSTNHGIDDVIVAKFNPEGQPVYITYLGGSHVDWGLDITTDADGNAYLTGFTASTNFPVANAYQPNSGGGGYDAFVTKLNPTGSALVFSTYLGGNDTENSHGSGAQSGAIALDANRNVYVTGYTDSTNFPVLNAIQPDLVNIEDVFITKFNPAGSALIWSTYLGGVRNDQPKGIAVDSSGNVIIAGFTTSDNYPTANAFQPDLLGTYDGFVSKINAAGSALVYSTYLGGNDQDYVDEALDVAVDPSGNAYVTGFTGSLDFPIAGAALQSSYNGGVDAFVSRFSPTGSLSYSSYLGGSWSDDASSIAVNSAGEAFIFGSTQSDNFPTADPLFPQLRGSEDAFVTRFNATGSALVFSTFFGGSNNREMQAPGAIAIDQDNTIYITGNTEASDFPTTANAYQPFRASVEDAFVSRISERGSTATPTPVGPTPTVCALNDYSISQSTGATIVPGTAFLPNSDCNDCTSPMVLPFPVQFYNQTFTQARASSNGNLQFTSDNSLPFNYCLPNPEYNNTIYGYWDDLFLDCRDGWGCGIYTSVSGSAPNRIFNVEWRAHRNEPPVVNVKFEIRLYENSNGRFDIIYGSLDNPGDTASVGVQRDTGSRFTQYSCNTGGLSQGLQLTFTLPPCQVATPSATPVNPSPTNTPEPMPTLAYSTYFGSWERDSIEDIGRDAVGNIYIAGTTFDVDFNYGDIMVAKFTPDGQTLLWRRLIGGTRIDYGYALSVDAAGNATVAGIATSNDYPLLNPIQSTHHLGIYDVVMTKLDPAGNMIFSTYLGGNGADYAERLATDAAGNVYLVGHTDSSNFPTTAGAYQTSNHGSTEGFVTKITPNGSAIVWSTYLGGIYADEVHDIALDSGGNIYLTGFAGSPDFPMVNAFQSTYYDGEAFVTKMNPQGTALIYSTYLGGDNPPGPGEDNGQGITVDAAGYAYVTGFTQSPNFPTTPGSFQPFFRGYFDAFVTKLTPAGNALVYSTFVGGTLDPPFGDDEAFDIAVDGAGQAHITGKTNSPDFPVVRAVQPQKADVYDAFVTKLNSSGADLVYSTFLGGNYAPPDAGGDDAGTSILVDGAGNAVIGGGTDSLDFPIASAYQPDFAGSGDGFISKISGSNPVSTPTPMPVMSGTATTTATVTVTRTPQISTATRTPSSPTSVSSVTRTSTAIATSTPCTLNFSDVDANNAFYPFIRCLACRGIVSGYSDGTFRPNNEVTRGQLAKIVANAAGFNEPVSGQTFTDVSPSHTFYPFIERMAARGVLGGYADGTFRPGNNASRGQIAKIVSNAAGYNEPVSGQTFADVAPGTTFYEFIERLSIRGVIGGYSDGTFRPGNNATRGQTSKIVANTFFPSCQTQSSP